MKAVKSVIAAGILLISPVFGGIIGSKHDLSNDPVFFPGYDQVCVFCHTPHFSNNFIQPLWNRKITDITVFRMYDSPTLDGEIDRYPNSPSLTCLSCHDGVSAEGDLSAVNSYDTHNLLNGPGPGHVPDTSVQSNCKRCHFTNGQMFPPKIWRIGADLRDDHPVSVRYPSPDQDSGFNPPPDPVKGWLEVPLYNGKVECPTCHDPHNGKPLFLRMTNGYSQLCRTCHKK